MTASWGLPLPLPPYPRFAEYRLDEQAQRLVPGGAWSWAEPNGQTYLKLLALELDDPQAILAFVRQHGILRGWRLFNEGGFDWIERYLPLERSGSRIVGRFRGTGLYEQLVGERRKLTGPEDLLAELFGETLAQFRFAASCLRAFTRIWLAQQGQARLPLVFEFPLRDSLEPNAIAEHVLCDGLSAGLRSFTPRLSRRHPERGGATAMPSPTDDDPSRTLYAICCLELFNHIVTNANHRLCAADDCRKVFVFQEGGARYQQYRKDAKYCSPSCRWRVAKRAQRQRQSQALPDPRPRPRKAGT